MRLFLCYFAITSKNCPRTCNYSITFKSTIAIPTSKSLSNAPASLRYSLVGPSWLAIILCHRDWPVNKEINCSWQGLKIKLGRIFLGADFSPHLLNYYHKVYGPVLSKETYFHGQMFCCNELRLLFRLEEESVERERQFYPRKWRQASYKI